MKFAVFVPRRRVPYYVRLIMVCVPLGVSAAGCEVFGGVDIDPPSLNMVSEPPPVVEIVPTHVMISNGAGEILVDQDLTAPYRVEADPPLEKLDGKLTIKTSWDNGTTSVQEFTHTPGTKVSLKQDGTGYTLTELVDKAKTEKPGGHE